MKVFSLFLVFVWAHIIFSNAQADVSYRTVALTDTEAPGAGSGVAFHLFLNAGIGGGGDVTAEGFSKMARAASI